MAANGRVNAVRQVEISYAADAVQNKRDQWRVIFFGHGKKYGLEFFAIAVSHVRWDLHPSNDDFRLGVLGLDPIDNGLKIFPDGFGGNATQAIVATELKNQNVDATAQKPINSIETPGRSVATLSGIDNLEGPLFGLDPLLNQGGIGLADLETVTGGDTVAEKQYDGGARSSSD